MKPAVRIKSALVLFFLVFAMSLQAQDADMGVWEIKEITLTAANEYDNYYTDVTCWVELEGPGFSKRVYGFWDGGNTFRVRVTATEPGIWHWTSGSNHPGDEGLNGQSGSFSARAWTEREKRENPTRRGFLRPTPNGHALQYADGTPYFMVGDTWLAGATWRLPFRNAATSDDYVPGPGMGFEDAVIYRKNQGFNSVSMIAAFPNWDADLNPSTHADENGIYIRNAWEKFGYDVADGPGVDASGGDAYWGTFTAKSMRDEYGHLPFAMSEEYDGVSDFNKINPEYFQSLDKKMDYLAEQGFVPLLETIRRDVGPSWDAYFDFNETFARFVQYLASRYGAHNFVYSVLHLDWIPDDFSLTADQFNEALTYHLETYGPMPFAQPVTVLIDSTTYEAFGHAEEAPWLTMHSVGNKPRDHRVKYTMETIFNLDPPYPTINFEPYYTGWHHEINMPGGERPPANSDRDNYFARAQMYGSVLSGGLSGHVHGTAAYDITTTGEPDGARPHVWDAFQYESAGYMRHLELFMLSEGDRYQQLKLARNDMEPGKASDAPEDGLDGWAYMMRTEDKNLAMLYFENESELPVLHNFTAGTKYTFRWFDTMTGQWHEAVSITADSSGMLTLPGFPEGGQRSVRDWAAKITVE
ncbi:DUF5060 domain-containing protein [Balneolales bacterium ANBcel1]|nr:DUF5060 domain-containing protein [Balneolales bacterium ANBcel1]